MRRARFCEYAPRIAQRPLPLRRGFTAPPSAFGTPEVAEKARRGDVVPMGGRVVIPPPPTHTRDRITVGARSANFRRNWLFLLTSLLANNGIAIDYLPPPPVYKLSPHDSWKGLLKAYTKSP